tara:strand:- start:3 stop:551 length:549 start_codon:yes stop_codon:yes gene_type:complete
MEYNNATSPDSVPDTDIVMSRNGRLEERPSPENTTGNAMEWQHMKGHVNEVQSHLLAAIEPLLTRIQMLESDVEALTHRLNKKLEHFGSPTFDSKLDDIAQHYVEQHFERMQADDISGFEDAVYDIVDAYGIEHKVEEVIEGYDFEDIVAEYQGSNFVEQHKSELVSLWRDMLHNLKVTYDD